MQNGILDQFSEGLHDLHAFLLTNKSEKNGGNNGINQLSERTSVILSLFVQFLC